MTSIGSDMQGRMKAETIMRYLDNELRVVRMRIIERMNVIGEEDPEWDELQFLADTIDPPLARVTERIERNRN